MQHLSRQCIRLSSLYRGSALHLSVREVLEPATLGSTGQTTCMQLSSLPGWLCSHDLQYTGAPYSTETGASEPAHQPLSKQEFAKLSLQQKKAILKPEKGRNQFKRLWKKNAQIRNAHKTRKEQQARANEDRHKSLLAKWSKGAALWQPQKTEETL